MTPEDKAIYHRLSTIAQMRDWLNDCEVDTYGRSDREIINAVERNYDGGVEQFLLDAEPNRRESTQYNWPR